MLQPLTLAQLVASALLGVLALYHLARGHVVNDPLILVAALVEVTLLVQLVVGLARSGAIADGGERATFIAYLFTVPVVVPVTVLIAIKERTRSGMAIVLGGALTVMVLVARLQQIWTLNV